MANRFARTLARAVLVIFVVETQFSLSFAIAVPSSPLILGFTLVDSTTKQDLRKIANADTINVLDYADVPVTIRVDVAPRRTITWMKIMWIDTGAKRDENEPPFHIAGDHYGRPPYYLPGDQNGDEATALKQIGTYTIEAAVLDHSLSKVEELKITFSMINTTPPPTGIETTVARTKAVSTTAVSSTPLLINNDVAGYESSIGGTINGELKLWHKVTLGFTGVSTSETNNTVNPFTDLRVDVTFVHQVSGKTYIVPGFYACDGNSANTGSSSGSVWLVHFRPDEIGTWSYNASYVQGANVAIDNKGAASAAYFDGATGSFDVSETDKVVPDLRAKGRLRYVGEHHLQFANGDYFLKAGADSPENLLAYEDFDNTPDYGGWRKTWAPHVGDYEKGDPTWMGGKGRGLIGAVNYLSSKGMNAISFLTMNVQGDDDNVFPYLNDTEFDRLDCSKTAQWDIVFDHAESKGMFLHFKTMEIENDHLLDNGALGPNRTLYYRELIARFGHHLALNYNLGEENTNSHEERLDYIDYFQKVDPYKSPIVMHTWPGSQEKSYRPLLGVDGFTGVSIQTGLNNGFAETLKWVQQSANAGQKWVVAFDEQGPAGIGVAPDAADPTHDTIRKSVLWANLLAGGAGVEYYFVRHQTAYLDPCLLTCRQGYDHENADLSCEDWRSRSNMWDQSRYALDFFSNIPFWKMINADALVSGDAQCLIELPNYSHVVVYLPKGGSVEIDMSDAGSGKNYSVKWYNPRRGGDLIDGSVTNIATSSGPVSLGLPPSEGSNDWAVLLQCTECSTLDLGPGPLDEPVEVPISAPSLQVSPVAAQGVPAPPAPVVDANSGRNVESSCRISIDWPMSMIAAQILIVAVMYAI